MEGNLFFPVNGPLGTNVQSFRFTEREPTLWENKYKELRTTNLTIELLKEWKMVFILEFQVPSIMPSKYKELNKHLMAKQRYDVSSMIL